VQFQQQVVREFPMIPYSEVHSRRLPYTSFRRDGRVMGQTPLR
jgi:hypothetical protein